MIILMQMGKNYLIIYSLKLFMIKKNMNSSDSLFEIKMNYKSFKLRFWRGLLNFGKIQIKKIVIWSG